MMSTINKIFLDSSVFIEGSKETAPVFFKAVTNPETFNGFINDVVCSETWYIFLGLMGGASPLALKQRTAINSIIAADKDLFTFYRQYTILPASLAVAEMALKMMEKYNLLPNDALIFSTGIVSSIPYLASHDPDFANACTCEGLVLITPQNYLTLLPHR